MKRTKLISGLYSGNKLVHQWVNNITLHEWILREVGSAPCTLTDFDVLRIRGGIHEGEITNIYKCFKRKYRYDKSLSEKNFRSSSLKAIRMVLKNVGKITYKSDWQT